MHHQCHTVVLDLRNRWIIRGQSLVFALAISRCSQTEMSPTENKVRQCSVVHCGELSHDVHLMLSILATVALSWDQMVIAIRG